MYKRYCKTHVDSSLYNRIPVDVSVDDHQMETVGDKYMLVSGLPEKNSEHAHNIALAAVDMLRTARDIRVGSHPVQVGHHVTCCAQHVTSASARTLLR